MRWRTWNVPSPAMAYTRDVMEIMTRIRQDWGMQYPEETGEV